MSAKELVRWLTDGRGQIVSCHEQIPIVGDTPAPKPSISRVSPLCFTFSLPISWTPKTRWHETLRKPSASIQAPQANEEDAPLETDGL
ncbi:hypothetical protein EJ06DRAFT_528164, partial [Trichodelitschia bisporula]